MVVFAAETVATAGSSVATVVIVAVVVFVVFAVVDGMQLVTSKCQCFQ